MNENNLTIIATGNPIDGFHFLGPFVNRDEAVTWATDADLEPDWWIAPLTAKETA